MDGTDIRLTALRILPFSSIGGSERRACQVFALADGTVLALQATCVLGDAPSVTLFATQRPVAGEWSTPVLLANDLAVPAALSLTVAPVLMRDGSDFAVVWPLDADGLLKVTPGGADLIACPGRISALCGQGDDLYTAVATADGAQMYGPRAGQAAQPFGPVIADAEVTMLAWFEGQLHAATASARAGFDLWRSAGGAWSVVMTRGAWRYGSSPRVTAMAVLGDTLYVAADGPDITHVRVGDEHPEVLVVDPQGSWRLLSGQARFSPDGLRMPETVGGPGVPACCGLAIGGMRGQGDGVQVWLKARGAGPGVMSIMTLTAGGWSTQDSFTLADVGATTLAVAADGTVFVAAGADAAATTGRKPLMVAVAAQ